MLLLINFTDIMMIEQFNNFNCNFLKLYNTTDYVATVGNIKLLK